MRVAATLLILSLAGCGSWGRRDDHVWSVQIPRKTLKRGEDLQFRVETRDRTGRAETEVRFYWSVDWVGLTGSRHKGRSFEPLDIRSKGGAGEAFLRIFAYDPAGDVVEVLREPIQVN
jgi:hypothetical protein